MDFSFTPEQEDLRREARAFLEQHPSPTMEQLAELGWVGILRSDDFTFLDAAVLFEELGRVLYDGPYVLNEVAAQPGDEIWSIEIDGFVPHLEQVGRVLTPDMRGTRAQGETVATVDETLRLGRVSANGAETADGDWEDVRLRLLAALALEAVGIGSKAVELAIAYVKEREQFGKKIGTYQAISHSLVDAYVAVELSRSLALWAAWSVRRGRRRRRRSPRPLRSRRRPRRRCSRARSRSRRTAASASRGSTRCTATTSARCGSRARSGTAASTARRSLDPCWASHRRVDRHRRGDRAAARRARLGGVRVRAPRGRGAPRHDRSSSSTSPTRRRSPPPRRRSSHLDALVDNAGIAIAAPLEFLPPEELDAAARRQRRRPAARTAGVPARASPVARARRDHGVDRRTLGAAVPRRLRDVEVRARGDGGRAACRARAVRDPGRDRRARDDRDADVDEAPADRRDAARPRQSRCTASGCGGSRRSPPSGRARRCRRASSPIASSMR